MKDFVNMDMIKILDIVDQEDGSGIVQLELTDEFIALFCELEDIKEFSQEKFQDWFIKVLTEAIDKEKIKDGDIVSCIRPSNADGSEPWTVTGLIKIDSDNVGATIVDDEGFSHYVWLNKCELISKKD